MSTLELSEAFLFSFFLSSYSCDHHTTKDDDYDCKEGPLIVFHAKAERIDAMECTLNHLILAVKAKLALVPIAAQTIEQVDIVEKALHPERNWANVLLTTEKILEEESCIEHSEYCSESCARYIHFILYTPESTFETISVCSLICLALLNRD